VLCLDRAHRRQRNATGLHPADADGGRLANTGLRELNAQL
jgi:hypothetical protein